MRNRIDIDKKTRHAIIRDIGERLRAIVRKDPEVPTSLGEQIDRRRELAMAADRPNRRAWVREQVTQAGEPRRSVAVYLVVATKKLVTDAREISIAVSMRHPIATFLHAGVVLHRAHIRGGWLLGLNRGGKVQVKPTYI